MALSRTLFGIVIAASTLAVAGAIALGGSSTAQAQAGIAPCSCSAPVEVVTGSLPTSARASITHCQCGPQSCAVLNSQVLQCSK